VDGARVAGAAVRCQCGVRCTAGDQASRPVVGGAPGVLVGDVGAVLLGVSYAGGYRGVVCGRCVVAWVVGGHHVLRLVRLL
jgi:hypothetical protein